MNTILQKRIEEAVKKTVCPQCVFNDGGTCNNDDDCKLFDDFVGLMTFALQNQWISVDEALPPIREKDIGDRKWSKWVLVMTHEGGAFVDSYAFHRKEWINNGNDVTHWAPIPSLEGGEE